VLIPKDNWQELFTGLSGIEVIPIRHVSEALRHAVVGSREPLSHISRGVPEGGLLSASNASLTP
jgi:Lon-like ATP-dependent protease